MGRKQRFDTDFKRNAVKLVLEQGENQKRVRGDLGVGLSTLQKWVRETKLHGSSAFPGSGNCRPEDEK